MPLTGHGPFPPTPENVYKAMILGAVVGALLAVVTDKYFKKKLGESIGR